MCPHHRLNHTRISSPDMDRLVREHESGIRTRSLVSGRAVGASAIPVHWIVVCDPKAPNECTSDSVVLKQTGVLNSAFKPNGFSFANSGITRVRNPALFDQPLENDQGKDTDPIVLYSC
jgi:hypothetical protein